MKKVKNEAIKNAPFLRPAMIIALLSLSALSGCATTGKQNDGPDLNLAKFSTVTTHAAVNSVESNYQSSDVNELSVYAPSHYSTAGKAIEDAKSLLAQSQPRNHVIQKIAVAEAILKDGDRVMRKVKEILKPEISIKQKLDLLNSKSAYSTEYGSLNERFNKLILEIESGNTKDTLNREKLLKDMQRLEHKSLRFNAMNEPREILKRVKYRGGEQLAPITYAEAMAVFKRAEEFITLNPDYDIGITQIGREALFAAKRALYITEGVSALKQRFEYAPEQIILDEEYRMYRVARQLADLDYRDNSLEVQSELLAKDAAAIALELENKDGLVIALRDTLIKVRDSSSRLTMLSDSAERLEKEKNQWIAKEALFKAKVTQLEDYLKNAEAQLDFTQQKLLAFKADNTRLLTQSENNAKQTTTLKKELDELKHHQQHQLLLEQQISSQKTAAQNDIQEATPAHHEQHTPTVATETPVAETKTDLIEKIVITKSAAETVAAGEAKNAEEDNKVLAQDKKEITPSNQSVAATKEKTQNTSAKNEPQTAQNEKQVHEKSPEKNPEQAPSKKTNIASEEVAVEKGNIAEKKRAKITEKETLEAILSAKELISSLKTEETRLAQKKPSQTESDSFFGDEDEDAFVDANE